MESSRAAVLYVQNFFAQYIEELNEADKIVQCEELKEDLQDWLLDQLAWKDEDVIVSDEQQLLFDRYYDLSEEEIDNLFVSISWWEIYSTYLVERTKDMITQSIDRNFTLPPGW